MPAVPELRGTVLGFVVELLPQAAGKIGLIGTFENLSQIKRSQWIYDTR